MKKVKTIMAIILFVVSTTASYSVNEVECFSWGPLYKDIETGLLYCGNTEEKRCTSIGSTSIDPVNPYHYIVGERINVFVHNDPSDNEKGTGYINALVDEEFDLNTVGPNVLDYIIDDGQTSSYTDYDLWKTDVESGS